jgi:outer membrane lipoprotein-sorting protein
MNILRRISLTRLLLLCGVVVAAGASLTAIAFALGSGPTPAPKPLADAVHDALTAPPVEGVSANIQLTNHLLEGANLATGGGEAGKLASSPLLAGGAGRLWISKDGHVRLELQSEQGDTQVLYDGHTVQIYDAASNTLYRYTPPPRPAAASLSKAQTELLDREIKAAKREPGGDGLGIAEPEIQRSGASEIDVSIPDAPAHHHAPPTVAEIEKGIAHLGEHATVSGATPTDIAGQPAYTVRISPRETGSLIGGAELSWDAVHGVPLRAAIFSSTSSSPALELAASSISYGPVPGSVFDFTPPKGVKVEEIAAGTSQTATPGGDGSGQDHPKVTVHGHGISGIAVVEAKAKPGEKTPSTDTAGGLPTVSINGASATELATELGTLLSFERAGVRYVVAGSLTPAAVEAVARGL